MIIKFNDYINEELMYTDSCGFTTLELPVIKLQKTPKSLSGNVETCINEILKTEIIPYFRNLKIGIKNVIFSEMDDDCVDFYLRVTKDFIQNIIQILLSDDPKYDKIKMNDFLLDKKYSESFNLSKHFLIMNLKKYNNPEDYLDIKIYNSVCDFLKYQIMIVDHKPKFWQDEFNKYLDKNIEELN